jgi:hypothetical protein
LLQRPDDNRTTSCLGNFLASPAGSGILHFFAQNACSALSVWQLPSLRLSVQILVFASSFTQIPKIPHARVTKKRFEVYFPPLCGIKE